MSPDPAILGRPPWDDPCDGETACKRESDSTWRPTCSDGPESALTCGFPARRITVIHNASSSFADLSRTYRGLLGRLADRAGSGRTHPPVRSSIGCHTPDSRRSRIELTSPLGAFRSECCRRAGSRVLTLYGSERQTEGPMQSSRAGSTPVAAGATNRHVDRSSGLVEGAIPQLGPSGRRQVRARVAQSLGRRRCP